MERGLARTNRVAQADQDEVLPCPPIGLSSSSSLEPAGAGRSGRQSDNLKMEEGELMGLKQQSTYTLADYWKFPSDGQRWEILEGELVVTPSPAFLHQSILSRIFLRLGTFVEAHRMGTVLCAPMDVIFSDISICQPDLLYIRKERLPDIARDWIRGAPDLVIEILSPSTERWDRMEKRRIYASYGVQEYWMTIPADRTILQFRLEGTSYPEPQLWRCGQSLTSPLFPGFLLSVDGVFSADD